MSEYLIQSATLEDIADAIRSKTGGSALINPEDMASEIESIQTGGDSGGVLWKHEEKTTLANSAAGNYSLSPTLQPGGNWTEAIIIIRFANPSTSSSNTRWNFTSTNVQYYSACKETDAVFYIYKDSNNAYLFGSNSSTTTRHVIPLTATYDIVIRIHWAAINSDCTGHLYYR